MSLPAYAEYKDSGVEWLGDVPKHWAIGSLKNLLKIRSGQDYKTIETTDENAIPVIGSGGQFTYATKFIYDGKSILLGRKGTIDKPLYIEGQFWTVDTMFYTEISEKTDPRYAYWTAVVIPFGFYSTSTALPSMSQFDLSNHAISYPDLIEQTTIARFLDHETAKIDALIAEQQRLIGLLKEKRQAVISHAVTKGLDPNAPMKDSGVAWLGDVPEHWEVKKLGYLGDAIIGLTYSPDDVADDGVLVLRSSNVQNGKIFLEDNVFVRKHISEKLLVRKGDILICSRNGSRDLIGKNAMIGDESKGATFGAFMTVFRSVINDYIYCILNSHIFSSQSGSFMTSTVNQLTTGNLNSFLIPLPPRNEQVIIARFLDQQTAKIDELISHAHQGIDLLKERRSALISAAVTGKIDVRGWQPPATAVTIPQGQQQILFDD